MTNADKFRNVFGLYATELWSMPEKDFLKWLNSEAMNCSKFPNSSDLISRQALCEYALNQKDKSVTPNDIMRFPSAEPDIAEKLYQYKCYITDQEGLQHEVIHVGDIRRVTGWEI